MLAASDVTAQTPHPAFHVQAELETIHRDIGPDWPAGVQSIATTPGEVYLGNLNGQIHVLERKTARLDGTGAKMIAQGRLAVLLYHRFRVEGRLADAERARRLMHEVVSADGSNPSDRLIYARILLGFHDFDGALEQVEAARAAGAVSGDADAVSEAVHRAMKLPEEPGSHPDSDGYITAVQRAAVEIEHGRLSRATDLLRRAQELYRDTSPFPLAWIHVQQGVALLRAGDHEGARTFFAAAHERMPEYYVATEHLAETEGLLGNAERAARLYRDVTAQNDQPLFWHGLAGAEAALGNEAAAADAARRAKAGYEALLARHPVMYADHAIGFYIEIGQPERALELAQLNYRYRKDVAARLALAEALLANGGDTQACDLIATITAAGLAPPELSRPDAGFAVCEGLGPRQG